MSIQILRIAKIDLLFLLYQNKMADFLDSITVISWIYYRRLTETSYCIKNFYRTAIFWNNKGPFKNGPLLFQNMHISLSIWLPPNGTATVCHFDWPQSHICKANRRQFRRRFITILSSHQWCKQDVITAAPDGSDYFVSERHSAFRLKTHSHFPYLITTFVTSKPLRQM